MNLKDFWTIFLKIFGLYLIWETLILLPAFLSSFILIARMDVASFFTASSAIAFIILFFIFIVRYCIFRTEKIIEKLRLEKGFTIENLEIKANRSSLLSIAIIVLGGLMLADALPSMAYNLFYYFQHSNSYGGFKDNHASPYVISNLLKMVLGYLMVTESQLIINFIEKKRKNSINKIDDTGE
jgi:hypothetical protein